MSELELLRRVEKIARSVKMNTYSVLSNRPTRCTCGQLMGARGLQSEVQSLLTGQLRELEGALIELDMIRAGAGAAP